MALRVSRFYHLLPSGSKVCRLSEPSRHVHVWSTNINQCPLSRGHHVERRLDQPFSQFIVPPSVTAQFHATKSNSFKLLSQRRHYSKSESSDRSRSEGNTLSTTGTRPATQGGGAPATQGGGAPPKAMSSTERIKIILREYGSVAVVFHLSMSLTVLGTCYILVSNGLDVDKVMEYFNFESSTTKKGASTFAISYLLYKMLLPVRATITIACVPVIVRSLRARGWMKGVVKPTK